MKAVETERCVKAWEAWQAKASEAERLSWLVKLARAEEKVAWDEWKAAVAERYGWEWMADTGGA